MSNEELSALIRSGSMEHTEELWSNIEHFVWLRANNYNKPDCIDDMMQEAFLAMLEAVEKYDPAEGRSFIGYYAAYFMPKGFKTALYGGRSESRVNSPLNNMASLDAMRGGEEDVNLLDTLVDTESEAYYRHIEDMDYWRCIGELLQRGIDSIVNPDIREMMQYHYENDTTLKAGSEHFGVKYSVYTARYTQGIRHLRRYLTGLPRAEKERSGLMDYLETHGYYAGSVGTWKNHSFTSSTEWIAMKEIEWQERQKRIDDLLDMLKLQA